MRQAEELRYAILALQREGNRSLANALKPLGVTPAQAEVLRVLDERAPLTLAGLGDLLICESGTGPSRLVDRLVGQGLVSREVGAADRRAVTLTLTDAGRATSANVAQIEQAMYQSIDEAVGGESVDALLRVARTMLAGSSAGAALARRAERL